MSDCRIIQGDCLDVLKTLPDESVQTCVTSPPYFGLRDYGVDGQIGLEATPAEFVRRLVDVFAEVRRVLKADGTCWVNLGDSFFNTQNNNRNGLNGTIGGDVRGGGEYSTQKRSAGEWSLKPKDLIGIPWRFAFAMQDAGWYLRSDIIWHKPNPMPESVQDRCTKAHEYIFLLTKSAKYFYDVDAIREPSVDGEETFYKKRSKNSCWETGEAEGIVLGRKTNPNGGFQNSTFNPLGRNRRSVWTVTTRPYSDAHFATFPEKLIEPCILAGSREGDLVLDPFTGAGTTALVSLKLGRRFVGAELNPAYVEIANRRLEPILAQPSLI